MSLLLSIGIGILSALAWEMLIKPFVLPSSWYYWILKTSNSLRLMWKNVEIIKTKKSFELKTKGNITVEDINRRIKTELKRIFKKITFIENTTPYIIEAYVADTTTITIEIELDETEGEYPRVLIIQKTKKVKFRHLTSVIKDHLININRLYGYMSDQLEYDEGIKVELEITGKTLFDYFFKVLETEQIKIGANITLKKVKKENKEVNVIKINDIATPNLAKKVQELVLAGAWAPVPDSG